MSDDLTPIREALAALGPRLGIEAPLESATLWRRWTDIVGPQVAAHAQPVAFKDGTLKIVTDSPAWATELGYMVEQLRTLINEAVRAALVREIKVVRGPLPHRPETRTEPPARLRVAPPQTEPAPEPDVALERARRAWLQRRDEAR